MNVAVISGSGGGRKEGLLNLPTARRAGGSGGRAPSSTSGSAAQDLTGEVGGLRLSSHRHCSSDATGGCSSFRARAAVDDGVAAAGEVSERRRSFYDLLGIPEDGGAAEIKRAYKELARRYHPDYTRRFIEVQEAYETLSDPSRRALYDRHLAGGLHLAFSARRGRHPEEEMKDKTQWRNRWQDQVSELKRRSMNRENGNNLSWGARMRQKKGDES
ncbi:unnamed protein product [Spirodela intermedia]|uniref:J domain-containing protein n=1 Tax=Spirodela intermedia TaxID=51605 RepID=A0A7I8JCM1_SPIIN|nr:unnamed protein product [Spirodela intermedia]CAA6667916.1 unnamed protein product [Spirodela intermedia]